MHPVIRIVIFMVLVFGATFGTVLHLALGGVFLAAGYSIMRWKDFHDNLVMLKRMRWLFLSIVILYLWFTPGQLLFPDLKSWSPSLEGLQTGLYRTASLVVIVLAVNLLVRSVKHEHLVAAILWLLAPVSIVGLPRERLAIRIALVLEVMGDVQAVYDSKPDHVSTNTGRDGLPARFRYRAEAISLSASRIFQAVLDKAAETRSHVVYLHDSGPPPALQWGYPLLLLLVYCIPVFL